MELQQIEILLKKYLEGETSLQEEKQLRVYFTSEKVPEHLREYRGLFGFFEAEQHRIYEQPVPFNRQKKKYTWMGVAACIAVIVGVFLFRPPPQQDLGTIENPEIAMQKTKKVLRLIAQQMNTGKEKLIYLNEIENTRDNLIVENLKQKK